MSDCDITKGDLVALIPREHQLKYPFWKENSGKLGMVIECREKIRRSEPSVFVVLLEGDLFHIHEGDLQVRTEEV